MISQLIDKMSYSMNNKRETQKDYKRENSLLEHINCLLCIKKRFLPRCLGFTEPFLKTKDNIRLKNTIIFCNFFLKLLRIQSVFLQQKYLAIWSAILIYLHICFVYMFSFIFSLPQAYLRIR